MALRGPAVCSGCSQPIPAGVGHACTGQGQQRAVEEAKVRAWEERCRRAKIAIDALDGVGHYHADVPPPSDLRARIERIRQRRLEKQEEYADYKRHHAMRVREEDLHGMWDCAINMAEVSSALDELNFVMEALGEK